MGEGLALDPCDGQAVAFIVPCGRNWKLVNSEHFRKLGHWPLRAARTEESEILDKRIRDICAAVIGDARRLPFHILH
jgi:hypothetical protein